MPNPTARARAGQDRANLYNDITDKIIAELEAGRVPWVRPWGTAAAKAPLARAGYDATLALAHVGGPPGWWRELFALFGAITVGCTTWARVSILTEPAPGGSVAPGPAQSPIGAVTKGR